MTKQEQIILDYLENAFTGARMDDAIDTAVRIARAIAAFQSDPDADMDTIFTDEFLQRCYGDI
jgi:hypothetical protein